MRRALLPRVTPVLAGLMLAAVAPTVTATAGPTAVDGVVATSAASAALPRPGTVLRSAPLRRDLWIPRSTSRAFKLTYVTKDSHERRARSTGTVFVPHGQPSARWLAGRLVGPRHLGAR